MSPPFRSDPYPIRTGAVHPRRLRGISLADNTYGSPEALKAK